MKSICETCEFAVSCPLLVRPGSVHCALEKQRNTKASSNTVTEYLSCAGCQDIGKEGNEYPCCNCIRYRKVDHYMPKPDADK